jgi:Flp pilus assembly protein TadG
MGVLMLIFLLLGVFEVGRMVLVYTTIANAARIGVRYAEVHGPLSSAPYTAAAVQAVVQNYLGTAPMNTANASVTPSPSTPGAIGSTVTVTVSYTYDPFMTYFPLNVPLGSTSQGVIAF